MVLPLAVSMQDPIFLKLSSSYDTQYDPGPPDEQARGPGTFPIASPYLWGHMNVIHLVFPSRSLFGSDRRFRSIFLGQCNRLCQYQFDVTLLLYNVGWYI